MSRSFEARPYVPVQTDADSFELPLFRTESESGDFPSIILSSLSAGSMNYRPAKGNPARDSWIRRQGFDSDRVLSVSLVHSRSVKVASSPGELEGLEADGILTENKKMCAVVTVADCMPIFLYERNSGVFGVLHSGWKGTGILAEAFALLEGGWGIEPSDISLTFGPCIGTCCYPVDEGRARAFSDEFGSKAVKVIDGRPRIDLLAANLALAESYGATMVNYADTCTSCDSRLGSFRRQGGDDFTRMAACIGFPSKASA